MTESMMEKVMERMREERAAEATRTRVDDSLATLRGIPSEATGIREQLARDLEQVRQADLRRTGTDWRDQQVERVTNGAGDAVRWLRERAETAVATIQEWITAQDVVGDVNERLLVEMQETRAWARLRGQLDAGVDAHSLIQEARRLGDHRALSALRAEFAAWAATADRPIVNPEHALDEIDDALAGTAPKEQRAVLRLSRDTRGAAELAERATASLESAIAAYGGWQDNPGPLNKAVRVLDVQAANATDGAPAA